MIDFERTIRERLIQLREEAGLSQEEMAAKIGVSRSTVRGWETGVNLPGASALIKIAELYGVPIDYLFGREELEKLYVGKLPAKIILLLGDLAREIRLGC